MFFNHFTDHTDTHIESLASKPFHLFQLETSVFWHILFLSATSLTPVDEEGTDLGTHSVNKIPHSLPEVSDRSIPRHHSLHLLSWMTVVLQLWAQRATGERCIPLQLWSAPRRGISDLQSGTVMRGCYVNVEQTHHASRLCSFMKLNHVCLTAGTNPAIISKTGKVHMP